MSEHDTLAQSNRPYFLWDYDLTEKQVHEILRGDDDVQQAWLITRILEYAGSVALLPDRCPPAILFDGRDGARRITDHSARDDRASKAGNNSGVLYAARE